MNLVIDIGNSLVKLAVFQQDELVEKIISEIDHSEKKIENLLVSFPEIDKSILSSVSSQKNDFSSLLKNLSKKFILDTSLKLPFSNLYASPESLGNDRKALVAAASKDFKHKNTLVIDAGTCLTYDFKNKDNEYLGGGISPGLRMRYKALNKFTAHLPLLDPIEDFQLIGDTTQSSIHSGVINGMLKEIDGIIEAYRFENKDLTIIFTGGDAQFLSGSIKNGIFANSNFLLKGLNYILEFNINQ